MHQQLNVTVPENLLKMVKGRAHQEERSLSACVREALDQWLDHDIEAVADRIEVHESRISRLEEIANA